MLIKLVRHGESLANVGLVNPCDVGDHTIGLTPLGQEQARHAGGRIGGNFLVGSLAYTSPYARARQTFASVLEGAGIAREHLRV